VGVNMNVIKNDWVLHSSSWTNFNVFTYGHIRTNKRVRMYLCCWMNTNFAPNV
jgi:hypothetical protein